MIGIQNIIIVFDMFGLIHLTIRLTCHRFGSVYFALESREIKLKSSNKSWRTYRIDGWTISWPGELEHATPERESKTTNQGVELG